jgi:hypothetical protein
MPGPGHCLGMNCCDFHEREPSLFRVYGCLAVPLYKQLVPTVPARSDRALGQSSRTSVPTWFAGLQIGMCGGNCGARRRCEWARWVVSGDCLELKSPAYQVPAAGGWCAGSLRLAKVVLSSRRVPDLPAAGGASRCRKAPPAQGFNPWGTHPGHSLPTTTVASRRAPGVGRCRADR